MRLSKLTVFLAICFWQGSHGCIIEVVKLYDQKLDYLTKEVNNAFTIITDQIKQTRADVNSEIDLSKQGVTKELMNLSQIEAEEYGRALRERKSISDCVQDEKFKLQLINITETIAYTLCGPDLSLFLLEASLGTIRTLPQKINGTLELCLIEHLVNCDDQKKCINDRFDLSERKLKDEMDRVGAKFNEIRDTSKICAAGRQNAVISLIKELEQNFEYCVDEILGHQKQVL